MRRRLGRAVGFDELPEVLSQRGGDAVGQFRGPAGDAGVQRVVAQLELGLSVRLGVIVESHCLQQRFPWTAAP